MLKKRGDAQQADADEIGAALREINTSSVAFSKPRLNIVILVINQPVGPAARAARPTPAVSAVDKIIPQSPFNKRPTPSGDSVNMNGTRNAGAVTAKEFHVRLMSLSGMVEIPRPFDPSARLRTDAQGMLQAKRRVVMPALRLRSG